MITLHELITVLNNCRAKHGGNKTVAVEWDCGLSHVSSLSVTDRGDVVITPSGWQSANDDLGQDYWDTKMTEIWPGEEKS